MIDASLLPALHDALTVARHGSVARAAEALVAAANARGGRDNIAVLLARASSA